MTTPETKHRFTVYGGSIDEVLGYADNYGECKAIHKKWLEETNHSDKKRYAGLDLAHGYLSGGMALPAFYRKD